MLLGLAGGLLVQAWAIRPIYFWGFPAETGVQLQSWLALLLSEQEPDSVVKRWYATLLLVLLSREGWQNWLCSSPAATRLQVWARVTHFMAYKAWELRLHENLLLGDRVLPDRVHFASVCHSGWRRIGVIFCPASWWRSVNVHPHPQVARLEPRGAILCFPLFPQVPTCLGPASTTLAGEYPWKGARWLCSPWHLVICVQSSRLPLPSE
jgi:hypothetical protein